MLGPADFVGQWQLQRQIVDRYGHQSGTFRGLCTFQTNGRDQLDYLEEGKISFGKGPQMTANRRYQWHFGPDRVDVCFENGAAFHVFAPAGQAKGTEHPCGDDYYTVQYDFRAWPRWQAVWEVTGPRKDYTSTSLFTR